MRKAIFTFAALCSILAVHFGAKALADEREKELVRVPLENYLKGHATGSPEFMRKAFYTEGKFQVDESALDFRVPCFLLNPLVENAIKHGFDNSARPLKILIKARLEDDKLFLEVSNTGRLGREADI
ncbi:MAG: hypothetical protein ICV60_13105 [Pyrinomonadaceae bacterium]|nr:hypothetical protein [Pyrinomonadaceae bacterium]